VQIEPGPSPGILIISWLPVTIDAAGTSNGVRVTGYAIYADGQKVWPGNFTCLYLGSRMLGLPCYSQRPSFPGLAEMPSPWHYMENWLRGCVLAAP
jgi:hypothetical protein